MDIYSLTPDSAVRLLTDNGFNAPQADNIFKDIYLGGAENLEDMKLTSKKVISFLRTEFSFEKIYAEDIIENGDTAKYLFRLSDGAYIETVLMTQKYGSSICISTQSGCNMGCKFCCSGRLEKQRDLSVGEMTRQVMYIAKDRNIKIGNITVMGIGEPLDNYENLCGFLDIAAYPYGLAAGTRHITVSTCGLVPEIKALSKRPDPCNLALSLHAPDDKIRGALMPINKAYNVNAVISAAKEYSEKSGRKVLIEYIMLKGINDSDECAKMLAELIGGAKLFVNLIPFNASSDSGFECSSHERVMSFYDILKKNGVGVTLRREFGRSINAACGQLRSDRIIKGEA